MRCRRDPSRRGPAGGRRRRSPRRPAVRARGRGSWRAEQDNAGHLHPAEQLALTIAPRLVDIKYTLMRNNQWTAPAPSAA
ncbi:hypothetical protein CG747_06155 [Streptomyces sp. CB02959]|nr:hypothetical protein CG747_06155 [Streptomyces sp. CB02959]